MRKGVDLKLQRERDTKDTARETNKHEETDAMMMRRNTRQSRPSYLESVYLLCDELKM